MIGKKLGKWVAPLMLGAGLWTGQASAQIVVNDWTLNFGAVPGFGGFGELQHVNTLGFQGLFHSALTPQNPGTVTLGDVSTTDFLANVNSANGAVGVTTAGKVLGSTSAATGVELTARGNTTGTVVSVGPVNFDSRFHTGFLDVFVGLPGGAPNGANGTANVDPTSPTRGTGMGGPADPTDPNSVLIASFQLLDDGTGATSSLLIATGATKADFKLISALPGVLLDSGGNPLALGSLLALADAQTNVDPNGNPPTTIGTFTIPVGPLGGTCGSNAFNVCGIENGNLRIATAVVPEPASLALLGAALLASGIVFKRRRQS